VPSANLAEYEIRPLSAADLPDVGGFACDDADLEGFIRDDALRLQEQHIVNTYLARCSSGGSVIVAGYVSLLADAVVLETKERKKMHVEAPSPQVPALKVARLAVTADRQRCNGTGTTLLAFAYHRGIELSQTIGCRLLTVDAYPKSASFYEGRGFRMNRAKEYRDKGDPSMRLDLFGREPPAWL
jgi:hypothetical protein